MSPNPLRGEGGRIGFYLRNAATATIDIFDAGGRWVRRLASGYQTAGRYSIPWDGRRHDGVTIGQGVYWLRLDAEGQRYVKQLVLIR